MPNSASRNVLAIIPARKGSTRLPGKNIMPFAGKPMLAWAIDSALESGVVDRVFCSTDGEDIRDVALAYGAEVPFMRPDDLATSEVTVFGAVKHALEEYGKIGYRPDIVLLLQPTSPLRTGIHVREAIERLQQDECDSVVSLCETSEPPFWMRTIENDQVKPFIDHGGQYYQYQKLPKTYILNGAIYASFSAVVEHGDILGERVRPYIMDREDSIDIDTELDKVIAECLVRNKRGK